MTAPESNTFLKRVRAIRDFVARHIDSGVARESKKASCAALRSNASKNASKNVSKSSFVKSSKNSSRKACGSCTSRALLSLFVASATLLATFVIAPTSALSAGENTGGSAGANTASTEKVEGARSDSAKTDGEKQNPKQSESINTEPDKKNTGSSDTLKNDNKESNPVEKQNPASNNGVNKPKAEKFVNETVVKKNARDVQKKDVDSTEAANGTDRGANEEPQLPEVCKSSEKYNTPEKCYSITYKELSIKGSESESYYKVPQIIIPKIKVAGEGQTKLPDDVWIGLEKYGRNDDSVNYAFFKGENDKNDNYTAKSTKKVASSDGSIRFFPSKWLVADKKYKFKVAIHYPGVSKPQSKNINAKLDKKDLPNPQSGDLSLSLYDFVNKQDDVAVSGNKITIKPKSNSQGAIGGAAGGTDNKDVYDSINKLFIDSQSKDKRGELYHHMICNDGANNYTVDSFNGLSLKDKKDNPSADNQTQFKHKENQNRPDKNAENSAVYESDPYIERSQSWISGMPKKAGTFECKVFAFKNANLERKGGGKHSIDSTVLDEFDTRIATDKQSLFDNPEKNIVEDKWTNKASIKQGVDWDYKSVTIEVQSSKPPEPKPPEIGDNDLTLNVYPFKNGTGSLPAALTSDNNKISAMLGMELKPFVDATSAADSTNKITLRVLCSKGEKKAAAGGGGASTGGAGSTTGSGSDGSGSSGATSGTGSSGGNTGDGSQPTQPSGSSQSAEDLEYKTWSSNLAELGLSVPADDNQNTCHSNKEGDKTCESVDPNKKVAARTDMEVSIKPTDVGNYQCVVFALKNDALAKFNDAISKATQSGKVTPDSIKSELTKASPTAFKENKDFAAFAFNLHSVSKFTLPHTGGQSWNLQLGILAALLVNLLAAGFVISQSERGRKLILGRWRGLCNYV